MLVTHANGNTQAVHKVTVLLEYIDKLNGVKMVCSDLKLTDFV